MTAKIRKNHANELVITITPRHNKLGNQVKVANLVKQTLDRIKHETSTTSTKR